MKPFYQEPDGVFERFNVRNCITLSYSKVVAFKYYST